MTTPTEFIKGSQLPPADPLTGDEYFIVVQGGGSKRSLADDVAALVAPIATAAVEDRMDTIEAAQSAGSIGYATKADMDADLAHDEGTLALVTNDGTGSNNGTYRKTGASGAGSWVQSADRVTGLEGRVSTLEAGGVIGGEITPESVSPAPAGYRLFTIDGVEYALPYFNFTLFDVLSLPSLRAWYDPSDLTTLFQDDAGTVPVTAPGQPVGRMLDKSGNGNHATWATATAKPTYAGQVAQLGAEKLTNGTFDADTNWSKGAGWAIGSGVATITAATSFLTQAQSLTPGKLYQVTLTISGRTGGTLTPQFTGGTTVAGPAFNANGTYTVLMRAESGNTTFALRGGSATLSVDNVSLKEVTEFAAPYGLYGDGITQLLQSAYIPAANWSASVAFRKLNSPASYIFSSYNQAANGYFTTTPTMQTLGAPTGKQNTAYNVYLGRDFVWSNVVEGDSPGAGLTILGGYTGAAPTAMTQGYFYGGVFGDAQWTGAQVNSAEQMLWSSIGLKRAIAFWGDSFTSGAGATAQNAFPTVLAANLGAGYYNGGIGGQTSTEIKDRFIADVTGKKYLTNVFWLGRNNYASVVAVKDDIAACVAATESGRYLVLSILNGATEDNTTPEYATIEALNADLASIYGDRFVDVKSYLLTKGNGGTADNDNIAAGIVPLSLRSDGLHLNDAGYAHVADLVGGILQSKGWA